MPDPKKRRVMLISNSFCHGRGYLEHAVEAIQTFLGPINNLLFVPYALQDWDKYADTASQGFERMGINIQPIHRCPNPHDSLLHADAIFVGGGNTFRLLNTLYELELMGAIYRATNGSRHNATMPYIGASAGANLAGPTIMTTNDMPIVCPPNFRAFDLVPFQVNPHYIDPDPTSTHMGETRDKRIAEFHEVEENDAMVVGMREGSWVTVENGIAKLHGTTGAKLFRKGESPAEWNDGPLTLWE